ncbi:GDSL esterase/lipase At5g37690 [Ricinus communis]|uniref:Zinc finger protein, putative n=1 Tax=Ricinus communis TaxID=3988 RepID=B9T102_RICCO|nr:GDSL esterase/lipase At5g37690 [Ricinus communis]EEF30465.1 zinc finger protein, putative [Ricinus communis]|eukprot:XP_002531921.1 GDSL esterase/lipase At5g37690 [Ricinus communis]
MAVVLQRLVALASALVFVAGKATTLAYAASVVTFVFGDSLTEVGNNKFLQYSLARSDYPWYGIDFSGGQATGRFTNGRTIGDIISAKLGISSPPPYLSLSSNDDALLNGVNYASGGAGILNDTGLYFIQRLSFDDQIDCFKKTKEAIKARIGEEAANRHSNEAMYFIGIGSNDYVNNYLQPFLADGQQYTHDEFVELLISTLKQQLTRLYQLGARKIVFHGLGPLGCIPSQRVKSKKGECLKRVNEWVLEFNSRVQNQLATLNHQLRNARFLFADTYGDVLDLIDNPTAYGFKVSNTSCCNVDTSIGGLCLPNSKLCKNRKEYVFWDAFHPSDAANQVLAQKFFKLLFSNASAPNNSPPPSIAPNPSN